MMWNKGLLALGCVVVMSAGTVQAQPLMNGGFETVNAVDPEQPAGWGAFNGARRRVVGDGLLPTLSSAHGGVAAIEQTPRPVGPSDFLGHTSDALTDPDDANSPTNNPGYTFNPPSGDDINFGGWVMIPASDPVVIHRVGLKLEFRRTVNNSVYEGFDFFFIDPADPTGFPGLVAVTTPTGPGVHTNGVWLQMSATFQQSQFNVWPLPPVNPDARVSVLAIRTGDPFFAGARGTVFFDDLTFGQGTVCIADFNNSGAATVQDIFDFLAAYFASLPSADVNNSGAVTVQDIFDFLSAYFMGCP